MDSQASPRPLRASEPPHAGPGLNKWDKILYQGKVFQAFINLASLTSLVVNIVLFVMLLVLGAELFALKSVLEKQLIGGLSENFLSMDQAHIVTQIQVQDEILVKDQITVAFTLPLQQQTTVVLTQDTPVNRAIVYLNGQPVPTDIILRRGTPLDIYLDLSVPVSQTVPVELRVPVNLTVPVDIPLAETDLHAPFNGLRSVLLPYQVILDQLPDSWLETSLCGPLTRWWCLQIFGDVSR